MRTISTAALMVKDEDGEFEITVDGYVHYEIVKYGADADGNRGMIQTLVTDVTEIQAYTIDLDDYPLTADDIERASEALVEQFFSERG